MNLNYTKFLFLLLGLFLCFAVQAQKDFIQTNSAKESLQFAQGYYAQGQLQKAKRQLEHTVKIKKNFAIAHRLLGKVYFDLEDYKSSIKSFESSFDLDDKLSRAAFFECAEAYLLEGDATLANYYFTRFKEMKDKRYANANKESGLEKEYDIKLKLREENLTFIAQMDSSAVKTLPINLGNNINSKHDEYLPSITNDGENLLFTRNIKNEDENLFMSRIVSEGWIKSYPIRGDLNTPHNEGMAKFETHSNTFYFAGCKREEDNGCDLYEATFENGKVYEVSAVEGRLNSYFWDSQPSISCDGKQLFFASTREGGFGGSDIWVSHKLANGEWDVPQNLGPKINTPQDEEAPFIATDGQTLYFTSNGHPGMGNGDILVSYLENNAWSVPDNMGYPINSPAKELGIFVASDNQTAYFASSRKGGQGGMDIYQMELPLLKRPKTMMQIEGYVNDAETLEPIQTTIKFGNDDNTWEIQTDENGWFFNCFAGKKGYSMQIHEKNYNPYIDAIYLDPNSTESSTIQIQLEKSKPKLVPKTPYSGEERLTKTIVQIYFDFDSSEISAKNVGKLNRLADLINRYDDWTVNVVGYSDNVGDEAYNKQLSQKRADEVVHFLSQKSTIDIASKVNVVGAGSTQSQDTDEARQKSRRVDVILTR